MFINVPFPKSPYILQFYIVYMYMYITGQVRVGDVHKEFRTTFKKGKNNELSMTVCEIQPGDRRTDR